MPAVLTGCKKGGAADAKDATPDQVTVDMTAATTHSMETTVSAQGTLSPGQGASARVAPVVAGRLREVRVKEGDRVTAGEIVAILDSRPQLAQARSASAAATAADAQAREADMAAHAAGTDQSNAVKLARITLSSAELDRQTAVQQAQTALKAAETDLTKTKAGARPQEIAQADETVNQDRATRDRAATETARMQDLFNKGIAARRQLEDAQTAQAVAEAALKGAQQQASLLRAGARPEDLRAGELRVQQAHELLDQATRSGDMKVKQAQAALTQALQSAQQVAVKRQDAQALRALAAAKHSDLAAATATAGYAELRAPLSGVVTRRALNPGDQADPTIPVVEIADTHALNLLANLPAEEGAKLRMGLPAHVTSPDVPDHTFPGLVLSVGQVDPQTNLLTVRISVSNSGARLKAGAFATADIVLHTDAHAVVVPKQALVSHEGKTVVFVVGADNIAHQREVETGAEQAGLVEIVKGLKSGERIIQVGQYELTDGAKVQPAAAKSGGEDKS